MVWIISNCLRLFYGLDIMNRNRNIAIIIIIAEKMKLP